MPLPQGYPTWWGVVLARDCACVALFLCARCCGVLTTRAAKFDERGPQICPRACGWGYVGILRSRKNSGSHIDASHSRQPLVKGERLVRYEVNAVMPEVVVSSTLALARLIIRLFWLMCSARVWTHVKPTSISFRCTRGRHRMRPRLWALLRLAALSAFEG